MKQPTLPEGLRLELCDNALASSAPASYMPGDALPEGITVGGPPGQPEITIDSDKVRLHSARLSGPGTGTVHVKGNGPGTAIREGHGRGDAIRSGLGDGDAIRCGPEEHGDAKRMGNGLGNALREGSGPGDALREGMGGDAVRTGPGPGTATLRQEQRTTLRHRLMMAAGKLGMAATIAMTIAAHTHAQPIGGTSERNHMDRPVAELRVEPPAHDPPERENGAERQPDAVQRTAAEQAEGNRVHEARSHAEDAVALAVAGTGAAMAGIGAALAMRQAAQETPHADHRASHGSQKGHGAGHKAHHEHLPEEERERRRGNTSRRKTPLHEPSGGHGTQSVETPRTRLQRVLDQHRARRTSGGRTSHEADSTRPTAKPEEGAERMPAFRKGHVNPTPPKAPPPADAAAPNSSMSRSSQQQAR